jgi:hypothetical protein
VAESNVSIIVGGGRAHVRRWERVRMFGKEHMRETCRVTLEVSSKKDLKVEVGRVVGVLVEREG